MATDDTPNTGTGSIDDIAARIAALDSAPAEPEEEQTQVDAADDAEDVSEEETDEALEASDAEDADSDEVDADSDEDEADANDEEDEDDEEPEDQLYTVKINGKEEQITLTEALKGYQRQADYTRKMQALAEDRREAEQRNTTLQEQIEQYAQLLPALKQQVEASLSEEPDWNALYERDPIEWARQRELWRDRKEQLELVKAEQDRVASMTQEQQQEQLRAYVQTEQQKLLKALPEWKDPKVAKAEIERIRDYGLQLGFTPEELENTYDHRAVLALHKAMKYDAMVSKKPQRKMRQGPKPARPGSSDSTPTTQKKAQRQAVKRLKETGSVQDAANALLHLM